MDPGLQYCTAYSEEIAVNVLKEFDLDLEDDPVRCLLVRRLSVLNYVSVSPISAAFLITYAVVVGQISQI